MNKLNHLAIIMDGNGRWAENKKYSRTRGHAKGAKKAYEIIRYVDDLKQINHLSLFAFSTENWSRPESEVNAIMKLISYSLYNNIDFFKKRNIRVKIIGSRGGLPHCVLMAIDTVEFQTQQCSGLNLVIALNYSGKFDLLQAINKLSAQNKSKPISEKDIDQYLLTNTISDPDVIIRTGNENRISNFFLWQSAYSEIYFENKLWPEFNTSDLYLYISKFFDTNRRFGNIIAQI